MSSEARLVDTAFTTYQGPRAGRLAAIWSLAHWSALRALGARRGWKAKVIPISLTLLAFAPALVVLGLRAILGSGSVSRSVANAVPYSDYISTIAIVVLVFSVVITPELVCPDRRDRTLSLYFSTAIGRLDYVLGKIAAALMPLLLVTLAPVLLLYVGTVLFSVHPVGYLQANWLDLPRIIVSSLIVATFYGAGRTGDLVADQPACVRGRRVPGVPGHLDGDGRRARAMP